jgi:predicted Zn-dependent protease
MKRKHILFLALTLLLACLSCSTTPAVQKIKPGEKPTAASDEAGLWMYMDKIENNLKTSGRIETDPDLNAYVRSILCKLTPDFCEEIRFYIVRTPHFNAIMAPNGFMQIWTGLMLRAQNEAQLAYVLGHELAHYQQRHTLERWRAVRDTSGVLVFFQIAAAGAGVGYAGDIAYLATIAGIFAFNRDQERESDDIGFELMANAGYDFHEAANIWQALIEEREAADDPSQFILFATHPTTTERVLTLRKKAQQLEAGGKRGEKYQLEYLTAIGPFRPIWLKNELRKRDFAASQVVLDHLFKTGDPTGNLYFFQGELYRMRAEEGDLEKGIGSYQKALRFDDCPPAVHRSLGLMFWKNDQIDEARTSLETYLQLVPDAPDRLMIEAYLKELK